MLPVKRSHQIVFKSDIKKHKGITQEDAGENLHLEKATSELEKR
jgi:hypothetical protein